MVDLNIQKIILCEHFSDRLQGQDAPDKTIPVINGDYPETFNLKFSA